MLHLAMAHAHKWTLSKVFKLQPHCLRTFTRLSVNYLPPLAVLKVIQSMQNKQLCATLQQYPSDIANAAPHNYLARWYPSKLDDHKSNLFVLGNFISQFMINVRARDCSRSNVVTAYLKTRSIHDVWGLSAGDVKEKYHWLPLQFIYSAR